MGGGGSLGPIRDVAFASAVAFFRLAARVAHLTAFLSQFDPSSLLL
jgi:hypothetical protein